VSQFQTKVVHGLHITPLLHGKRRHILSLSHTQNDLGQSNIP
jgi:hypothetical protein